MDGPRRRRHRQGRSGAGHPPEEESDDNRSDEDNRSDDSDRSVHSDGSFDIGQEIAEDQEHHIRHPPVPVPDSDSPFPDEDSTAFFTRALEAVLATDGVPEGFGVTSDELGEGGYDTQEVLYVGKRGGKELIVALPEHIWRARTEDWAKALHLMSYLLYNANED